MITSYKQNKAAKQQLANLTKSLTIPMKENVPDIVANAGKAQVQGLIAEIQHDLDEYEQLQNSRPEDIQIHSLDDLMNTYPYISR